MKYLLSIFLFCSWCFATPVEKLFIDDPVELQKFERQGYDFHQLVLGESENHIHNKALFQKSIKYQAVVRSLQMDLAELIKTDTKLTTTMNSIHRLFDANWLTSADATYELVGIVNRLDRMPFQSEHCGEIRFIYRLTYRQTKPHVIYSRLPMTMNAVFWGEPKGKCRITTKNWQKFIDHKQPSELNVTSNNLKSLEVNLQSVRWPSTVRPDMGGYAEYFLRVFTIDKGTFILSTLENTPDVEKITSNPELKKKLLLWIKDPANLTNIDEGVATIPNEFLTKRATSVALNGIHRLANAPFTQLFSEDDLKEITYANRKTFQSPHGLLRRLNDFSCVGCHQGRTVAGFHFLGKDPPEIDVVNAILVSSSSHFLLDQERRKFFFQQISLEKKPTIFRPFSVRADDEKGTFGAHCGLGDPTFQKWTCAPGFECRKIISDDRVSRTGVCEPISPIAGSSCQPGKMKPAANSHRDAVSLLKETNCRDGQFCEDTAVGFPGGMCAGSCASLTEGETCGAIAILLTFNSCLSRGKEPFAKCLADNVRPAAMKRCSETEPCRDDYICAKTAAGNGACIPPYFLFQLRVDGHPKPLSI